MPILPTRRDLGPLPQGPSTATAPAADTSAVGRSIAGFGGDVTAGIAVLDAAWKDAKKAEEESSYLRFEYAELARYKDAVSNLKPEDSEGFSARWYQESTARWQDHFSTYSDANRAEFGDRAFESVQGQIHKTGGAMSVEKNGVDLMLGKSIDNTSDNVWSPQMDSAARLNTKEEREAEHARILAQSTDFINGLDASEQYKFEKIRDLEIELRARFGSSLSVADQLTLDRDHPRNTADPSDPDSEGTGYAHMMTNVPYEDVMQIVDGARTAAKTRSIVVEDQVKQLQGAVANGEVVTEEYEQFMQSSYFPSLPEDKRILAVRDWEFSKWIGGIRQKISSASGDDLDAMEAAIEARDTDPLTSEVDKASRAAALSAISDARTLREDDSFAAAGEGNEEVLSAYIKYEDALSGKPVVEGDWDDDKPRKATPEETARFGDIAFALSKAEQIFQGTPDTETRVIGNDRRAEIIERLRKTVRDESGLGVRAQVERLKTLYGRHYPALLKDLVTKGPKNNRETLPSELSVAAEMPLNAPGQARLYDAIDAKAEGADPLDGLPEGVKSEIIAGVDAAMVELIDTLPRDASGELAKKSYREAISLLASSYYSDKKDAGEAVKAAYSDISTAQWNFLPTFRVPKVHGGKTVDLAKVTAGVADLRFFLETPLTNIPNPLDVPRISRKFDSAVLPPPTRPGQSEQHIREMYLDHMKNFGVWRTSPNEDGVILHSEQPSSIDQEMGSGTDLSYVDRNGITRPIVFTWDDLSSLYEQRMTQLGPYPSELPPAPVTGQQQWTPPPTPAQMIRREEMKRAMELNKEKGLLFKWFGADE